MTVQTAAKINPIDDTRRGSALSILTLPDLPGLTYDRAVWLWWHPSKGYLDLDATEDEIAERVKEWIAAGSPIDLG